MSKQKIYIIAGTTASGKSDLAIRLAKSIDGQIINGDSIQVYRDIPLLTARPLASEQQGIPHYLYGWMNEHENCSVTDWLDKAVDVIKSIQNPIVVGGTGMYLKALTDGINDIPPVDEEIRQQVRLMPIEQVQHLVQDCSATDPQRLRRALEVQLSTGKTLKWFQSQPPIKKIDADFEIIWINRPREEIRKRCYDRFLKMLSLGAVEQVKHLRSLNPTGGVTKAIGYEQICRYLDGEITYEKMIDLAVIATRQYAKRQQTWFKHQLKNPKIINNPLNFNI